MQINWGVTGFVSEIKGVEKYPDFEKSALATRQSLNTVGISKGK